MKTIYHKKHIMAIFICRGNKKVNDFINSAKINMNHLLSFCQKKKGFIINM